MERIIEERIYLRELEEEDASEEYLSWLNDKEIKKYIETPETTKVNQLKDYIKKQKENKNSFFVGIFDKENDKHIGNIKLEPIDWKLKTATLGILIGNKNYWGKAYGTESVKLMVDYAFAKMNLEKIKLGVIETNKRAIKCYENVGFVVKKIDTKALEHDGIKYDNVLMEINKMKLALGTVQFGLDYGINNKKGKVSKEEVFKILDYAIQNHIDILDTAYNYGESEQVIGEFMQKKKFKIISKLTKDEQFDESLKRLNCSEVYGCLIHDFNLFLENPKVWENLDKMKKEGRVKKIGFSLYHPKEAEYLLEKGIQFDIVQVPFSVFDQRFSEVISLLKKKGIEIYARSIFLQGLVFKDPEKLEGNFVKIKDKILKLKSIADDLKIPLSTLCINFAVLNKDIDRIVIGVDSLENLQENIKAINEEAEVKEVYEELLNLKIDDEKVIVPVNWSKKRIVAIIQARMSSTRLPGKVLKKIADKPMLFHEIERVKQAKLIDEIIVATGDNDSNKPIIDFCKENRIECFQGDEDNVLDRFYQAAKKFKADIIVRITGDCPLHDPTMIDELIEFYLKNENKFDYVSNVDPPSFPDGLDLWVFPFRTLEKVWKEAKLKSEREHVCPYIWKNPDLFRIGHFKSKIDYSNMRWTVDDATDFEFVKKIYENLYEGKIFYMSDILKFLNNNPNLHKIQEGKIRDEGYLKSIREDKRLEEEN